MTPLSLRRVAVTATAALLALPAIGAAQTVAASPGPGFMVFTSAKPPRVLQPGPGVWLGVPRQVLAPGLGGLAKGIPRAHAIIGRDAYVRLPFEASSIGVTVLRPVRARPRGGGLVLSRTPLEARLIDGDRVAYRLTGDAGIVVVFAVDAAGRGTASGRLIARLATDAQCRDWTRMLQREGKPNGARGTALKRLLLTRCVSPFGVPGADAG